MWPFPRKRMSDGEIIDALLEENDLLKQKCAARGELLRRAEAKLAGEDTFSLQALDEAMAGMETPFYQFSAVADATRALRNTITDLAHWAARQEESGKPR